MNLEAGQVGVVLFGSDRAVREGETVKRTGQIVSCDPLLESQARTNLARRHLMQTALRLDITSSRRTSFGPHHS